MTTQNNQLKNFSYVINFIVILILIFITLACFHFLFSNVESGSYDTIANVIDGFTAPFIGIIASILTFLAFKMQINANEQIQNQFKLQQFENHFYQMINLHRKNADEINLKHYCGRKCFAKIFHEYRFIFEEVKKYNFDTPLSINQSKDLSLVIIYFGVGNNVESYINENIRFISEQDTTNLLSIFKQYKEDYINNNKVRYESDGEIKEYSFGYVPFKGHISRLSHYFNHLFYTFVFVDNQNDLLFKDKLAYIEILKTQFSYYELILLDIYIISNLGNRWKEIQLKEKYNIFSEVDKINIYHF